MVGRKRKVVENEESSVKKKAVTKKDLEDLVQQLRQELETEKGRVVILDEEVLNLKQKIEGKEKEVEECKKELEELKKSKKDLEMQIQDTSSKNQKSSTRNIVESSEEDEPVDKENNAYHGTRNKVGMINDSGNGEGDSETEELTDKDDEETNFVPNREVLKEIMERVRQEVDRQKKIRQKQLARKQELVPIQQDYTILKFINELMSCGFTDDYLQSRKLSNQKSKRGADSQRKEMPFADKRKILKLSKKAWIQLPDITPEEIEQITKKAITWKLGNEAKKKKKPKYK